MYIGAVPNQAQGGIGFFVTPVNGGATTTSFRAMHITSSGTVTIRGAIQVGAIYSGTYTVVVTGNGTQPIASVTFGQGIWLVTAVANGGPGGSAALGCSCYVAANGNSYATSYGGTTTNGNVNISVPGDSWTINLVTSGGVGIFTWFCRILRLV